MYGGGIFLVVLKNVVKEIASRARVPFRILGNRFFAGRLFQQVAHLLLR